MHEAPCSIGSKGVGGERGQVRFWEPSLLLLLQALQIFRAGLGERIGTFSGVGGVTVTLNRMVKEGIMEKVTFY